MAITLYNYFRSSTSYRVRLALELKKLPYTYIPVHLLKNGGEQNSEDYRKLNPAGGVPTLVHDEKVISQSFAIIEYLDEAFPQTYQLMPAEPFQKAKIRQFCENINADMHALQNLKLLQYLEQKHGYTQDDKDQWCQHWIHQNFIPLEKLLDQSAGTFCFGSKITVADVMLIPQVITAQRFKTDLNPYPILLRVFNTCMQLPEFIKAHPFRQIDTPSELRIL